MIPTSDRVSPVKFYIYDPISGLVHVSADGGATFNASKAALPTGGGALRAVPGFEGQVWVPTPRGLFFSTDAGVTFEKIATVQEAWQIGFGRPAPGQSYPAIFLLAKIDDLPGRLFRSDDRGRTWILLNDSRHQFGWINAVTGDPRVFGRVYLGTGGRGIIYGEPAAK